MCASQANPALQGGSQGARGATRELQLAAAVRPLPNNPYLGPPVESLEYGYPLFSVVYFSRGTLPDKVGEKGHLAGTPSAKSTSSAPLREYGGSLYQQVLADLRPAEAVFELLNIRKLKAFSRHACRFEKGVLPRKSQAPITSQEWTGPKKATLSKHKGILTLYT